MLTIFCVTFFSRHATLCSRRRWLPLLPRFSARICRLLRSAITLYYDSVAAFRLQPYALPMITPCRYIIVCRRYLPLFSPISADD